MSLGIASRLPWTMTRSSQSLARPKSSNPLSAMALLSLSLLLQQTSRRSSHWRHPVHAAFPRYEVIVPSVFARVEQWHHRSCNGVNARQIGAFVPITPVAGEREAGRIALSCAYRREPPCCFGTMCSTWKAIRGVASCGRLQYPYALPARARTRPRVRWSHHAARRERKRRAFACIMEPELCTPTAVG